MKLKDKVAIVTGSSKGIGEGIARIFSQEGEKVVIVCRTKEDGERIAVDLGMDKGRALYVHTDVTKKQEIINLIQTTIDTFGKCGIRVNVICSGWIQTPLVEDWFSQRKDSKASRKYIYGQHPLGRIGTIEECGKVAAGGLRG